MSSGSDSYFGKHKGPKTRAATLIHEHIHLINENLTEAHPGGAQVVFERTALGLPYDQAVKNAYCYQYFALWLN